MDWHCLYFVTCGSGECVQCCRPMTGCQTGANKGLMQCNLKPSFHLWPQRATANNQTAVKYEIYLSSFVINHSGTVNHRFICASQRFPTSWKWITSTVICLVNDQSTYVKPPTTTTPTIVFILLEPSQSQIYSYIQDFCSSMFKIMHARLLKTIFVILQLEIWFICIYIAK